MAGRRTLLPKIRDKKTGEKKEVSTEAVTIRNMRQDVLDAMRLLVVKEAGDYPTLETLANEALALGMSKILGRDFMTVYRYD